MRPLLLSLFHAHTLTLSTSYRWAWIGSFIIYCIVLGLGSRGNYDVNRLTPTMDEGRELTGDVLSFLGIMFSVVRPPYPSSTSTRSSH